MIWNPFECLEKMRRFVNVRTQDFIMMRIEKYIKLNLDQGRKIMITFLPRDTDYGNRQADVLGKSTKTIQTLTIHFSSRCQKRILARCLWYSIQTNSSQILRRIKQ